MKIQYSATGIRKIMMQVAKDLENGKIIGWFQDGSEFGPRALGFRSILMDARRKDAKKYLNERVKHREWWRPFAPVIMEEHLMDWFSINKPSPYMLFSAKVKSDKRKLIPGVIHEDNTTRIQTVNIKQNPNLYGLLTFFHKNTNVPLLLNTSFNDSGKPIVETPQDAYDTFQNTNIDILVMQNVYIKKKEE